MGKKGKLSSAWPLYDPNPPVRIMNPSIRYVRTSNKSTDTDRMCDYIEGAEWWIARSKRDTPRIFRAFNRGDVACCLYSRTGAIVRLGKLIDRRQYLIAIQLVVTGRDWDLDLSLEDAGIYLEQRWDGNEVDASDYPDFQP